MIDGATWDEQKTVMIWEAEHWSVFYLFLFLLVSTVLSQKKMKVAMMPATIMVTERTKQTTYTFLLQ